MRAKIAPLLPIIVLVLATPAPAADLLAAHELARHSDPRYRQVAASRRATLEQRPQALAALLPSLSFEANAFANEQEIQSAFNPIDRPDKLSFGSHGYSLNFSQPLFRADRYIGYQQAGLLIEQADAGLLSAAQDLIIRVSSAYFEVLSAYDNLGFAKAEKKSLERQLYQTRQRFDAGLTAITDVQEAQAGYDRAQATGIEANNNVDNAREALREITGVYPGKLANLGDTMPLVVPMPSGVEVWTQLALQQNPTIIAAQHAVDVARQELRRQRSDHLPMLDLVARHGLDESGGQFGSYESTTSSIGVQLELPIYTGGQVRARTRAAHARLDEELEKLEAARRRTQRLTRQAYLGVLAGISRVQALKQAVVSSETALRATEAGFEVGDRTAIDVVAAERVNSEAKRNYARARYDYLLDRLRLKQAAGSLSEQDLVEINGWLE